MRTGTRLPWPVVSARSKVSRSSGGSRTARTDWPKHAHTWRGRSPAHQAKLDRYAALIAAGKKPMGRPPVPMEDSTRVPRARRVVRTRRDRRTRCRRPPISRLAGEETAEGRREHHRPPVADHADPARVPAGIQRPGRGHQRPADRRSPGGAVTQRPRMLHPDDAGSAGCCGPHTRCYRQRRPRHRHRVGRRRLQQRRQPDRPGPDRLIALGKGRDQAGRPKTTADGPPPPDATPREANRHRLRTPRRRRALYKRRGATVEPGIGNLKKIIDRFSRRGLTTRPANCTSPPPPSTSRKIHRAAPQPEQVPTRKSRSAQATPIAGQTKICAPMPILQQAP